MPPARKSRRPQLRVESLEARDVPANPTTLGGPVALGGAQSTWDFSDGGTFTPSPVFADVDGLPGEELIAVTGDRDVAAYRYSGSDANPATLLRTYDTGANAPEIHSTPLVVNMPGVGKVVVAAGFDGRVFAWNAATGGLLPGWPTTVDVPDNLYPQATLRNSVLGPLAAGDLTGDGVPEIVVTSFNHHVTAFSPNGSVLWRFTNDDSVLSGAVVADIDRDGSNDVVFGGDATQNDFYDAGGHLTALGSTGRRKWVKYVPQIVQSSPVLADIDANGTLEVFVGTGINFTNTNGAAFPGNAVYGVDSRGNDLPGWPYVTGPGSTDFRTPSPPAVADVNNDGTPEILIGDFSGRLHAIRPNGTALWVTQAFSAPLFAAPVVLDVDSDNDLDVVALSNNNVRAFDAATGKAVWTTFADDGTQRFYLNSPAVGQFKGNGTTQLGLLANGSSVNGQPRSPSFIRLFNVDPSSKAPEWTAARGDAAGNAVRRPPAFVDGYLTKLASYLGRTGPAVAALVNDWRAAFRTSPNLFATTANIVVSIEGRTNEIQGWYQRNLNRSAEPGGVNTWLGFLAAGNTFARGEAQILGSQEAFNLSGPNGPASATNQTWVSYLYQKLLGRLPQGGEDAGWVNALNTGALTRPAIALGFLSSPEKTEARVRGWYVQFQIGGTTTPPPATLQAAGWDLRRGVTEETVLLQLLTSGLQGAGSDYTDLQVEGAWLKAVYRDVLKREASQADLVFWLRNMEAGVTMQQVAYSVVQSAERYDRLVKDYFRRYLHRAADPSSQSIAGFVNQLVNGVRRETVIASLLASEEYFNFVGRTRAGFVNTIWADVLGPGRTPDPTSFNFWSNQANVRTELPPVLLRSDEYYFNTIRNDWLFPYVNRYAYTPPNQSATAFNPTGDPYGPLRGIINSLQNGATQSDAEVSILTSGEYVAKARTQAFWAGKRWKTAPA
jgi:hypothetical protein